MKPKPKARLSQGPDPERVLAITQKACAGKRGSEYDACADQAVACASGTPDACDFSHPMKAKAKK